MKSALIILYMLLMMSALTLSHAQDKGSAMDMAWSPDGKILAISGNFGIGLYDEDFQLDEMLTTQPTRALAWSPDGNFIATVMDTAEPSIVHIFDTQTHDLTTTFSIPSDYVAKLSWNADSQQIAIIGYSSIDIYDAITQLKVFALSPTDDWIDAAWSPDGAYIAAVGGGDSLYPSSPAVIYVWDATTGTLNFSIDVTETKNIRGVYSLAWHPDSKNFALGIGTYNDPLPTLDLTTRDISGYYAGLVERVVFVGWSADGTMFAGADHGASESGIIVWDDLTKEQLWYNYLTDDSFYKKGAWRPDSNQLAMLIHHGYHQTVHIIDATNGSEIAIIEPPDVAPITPPTPTN